MFDKFRQWLCADLLAQAEHTRAAEAARIEAHVAELEQAAAAARRGFVAAVEAGALAVLPADCTVTATQVLAPQPWEPMRHQEVRQVFTRPPGRSALLGLLVVAHGVRGDLCGVRFGGGASLLAEPMPVGADTLAVCWNVREHGMGRTGDSVCVEAALADVDKTRSGFLSVSLIVGPDVGVMSTGEGVKLAQAAAKLLPHLTEEQAAPLRQALAPYEPYFRLAHERAWRDRIEQEVKRRLQELDEPEDPFEWPPA